MESGPDGSVPAFGYDIRTIFWPDDAKNAFSGGSIRPSLAQPFAALCLIEIAGYIVESGVPVDYIAKATGFLIEGKRLVTAAHSFHEAWVGGERYDFHAQSVSVRPKYRPGSMLPDPKMVALPAYPLDWPDNRLIHNDVALLDVSGIAALNGVTPFVLAATDDAALAATKLNVMGYRVKDGAVTGLVYDIRRRNTPVEPMVLKYQHDTTEGQSGCPAILWSGDNAMTVVGIHHGTGGGVNKAVRVTATVKDAILNS